MIKTVKFRPQWWAEQAKPDLNVAVISITSPGDEPAKIQNGFHDVLRVAFDDLYEETLKETVGDVPDLCPKGPVYWHGLLLPNYDHAKEIIQFLDELVCDHVIVHCHAGVSRSAAVAQFIVDHYGARLDQGNFCDTACMNKRVYRLMKKVHSGEKPKIGHYIPRDEYDDIEVAWKRTLKERD